MSEEEHDRKTPTACYRCGHSLADEHDDQHIWDWHCRVCNVWCEKAATWTPEDEAYAAYERDQERRALVAAGYEVALVSGALGSEPMTEEERATYELWDVFTGNLIHDFRDREAALVFVWRQIEGLDNAAAAKAVERFALERVVDGESEVLAKGAQFLKLLSNEETARHRAAMEEYARDPDALSSVVAHQEQIERAWADAEAIADGDTSSGSWRRINAAVRRAVRLVRKRP